MVEGRKRGADQSMSVLRQPALQKRIPCGLPLQKGMDILFLAPPFKTIGFMAALGSTGLRQRGACRVLTIFDCGRQMPMHYV